MNNYSWLVNFIVIAGMGYLAFAMALAGWIAGLRKGQAVTLLPEQSTPARNLWLQLAIVLFALVFSAAFIYFLWIPIPIHISPSIARLLTVVGLTLFLTGMLVVVWARRVLGRMWGISTSRKVKLLSDHQLVKSGPYAVVRHPMYSGWWLALLGTVLIYRTWVLPILLFFSIISFSRRARLEEQVLSERFGAEWEAYSASTKTLIPWIY